MRNSHSASVPDQALAVPVEPVSRLDPTGFDPSRKLAKTVAFTDERGNRFIFPSWIIHPDDPDAPSCSSIWWQANLFCSRLRDAKQEWIDLDPEHFPNVRADAGSGCFRHGSATVLLFAGPEFEAIAMETQRAETPKSGSVAKPDAQPTPVSDPISNKGR